MSLRQVDVAEIVGSDQTTVSLWESGKVIPLPFFRRKLAELYKCPVDELFPPEVCNRWQKTMARKKEMEKQNGSEIHS